MKPPTRRFGRTELAMPVFTCGGMRYQNSWKDEDLSTIPEDNQKNLGATIERALELGITHIETARGYGTSELQLGRILPRLPRESFLLQTKVSPECDGKKFLETFDRSMSLLGVESVDLLSLHGINNAEILATALVPGGPLDMARQIQREGRARFIGFSTHADCEDIVAAINTGEFDYVNLHWYWVNRSNEPAIDAAVNHDMGVFIISPNDKGGKLYEPPPILSELCAPLSPMIFNNLFCLRHPAVHTLSIGAARPTDFDEHIRSLDDLDQTDSLLPAIETRLANRLSDVLGADWIAHWETGIPRWEACPGDMNIWEILRLWNYAKALDMVAFGKMRYNLLGQAGHWFPGQNAASFSDDDVRAVLSKSPFRDQIPGILREAHALLYEKPAQRLSES